MRYLLLIPLFFLIASIGLLISYQVIRVIDRSLKKKHGWPIPHESSSFFAFLKHFCAALILLVLFMPASHAETRVWLMRGMGGAWGGLAPGVDNIAAQMARVRGVTSVRVFEYYQTQQVADEIARTPSRVRVAVGGYSCGANAATMVAAAQHRPVDLVEGVQASLWCGGATLARNVVHAQETLNGNCWATLGLGCRRYAPGPGFAPSRLTIILRPDGHLYADDDPDAQRDMVSAVRTVAAGTARTLGAPHPHGGVRYLVRYHGQRP